MTRLYTRTGDAGETGLIGGRRVPKDDPRVEAYGTLDELNSAIGAARAFLGDAPPAVTRALEQVQHRLFALGAEIAAPDPAAAGVRPCTADDVGALEHLIDAVQAELPALRVFILPGGSPAGSLLHVARTVARRAERRVVALARAEPLNPEVLRYLNRLSDLLFVLARAVNQAAGRPETPWDKDAG
ncbi:MAG: cob(I)yrinic acid a,c-diamide adenosyltransferase [Armatimonadota bacterium]|nr:cob(I)yrinic acid a,c-diamide adenosyltransferase [Armatimonadota bacterium]MDR7447762.1 cob(I)yrinic acid a,c-diamide adenosyltransferase [Armatimonadota bacterium]MDR7458539.1 cob(I)yrinic acid a,c-diamide adenosyltransferase [Armatimonadota bacterium]MDR7479904.1 cob(I)yrinic acid a,c-diamide adenosyltransferase [Armatimonadota bacterium]MDR7487748.1 cob(I)yrinic acid a,c-diamide adenosyltransferase [Armatimonadota bacterium]